MEKEITIHNILGNTRKEQWLSVANILRTYNRHIDNEQAVIGFNDLCDEIARYINSVEDWVLFAQAYIIYTEEYYAEHNEGKPVCSDEFYNNEWQDEDIKQYYINKIQK